MRGFTTKGEIIMSQQPQPVNQPVADAIGLTEEDYPKWENGVIYFVASIGLSWAIFAMLQMIFSKASFSLSVLMLLASLAGYVWLYLKKPSLFKRFFKYASTVIALFAAAALMTLGGV